MINPDLIRGVLHELHSGEFSQQRTVDFRLNTGVSGDLTLIAGQELITGEIYLLTDHETTRRIEILGAFIPQLTVVGAEEDRWVRTEYQFRIV